MLCVRSYRRLVLWCFFALGMSCWAATSATAQISVVVAKNSKVTIDKMTKAEVKKIFAGVKLKWKDGGKIQIIDQPETDIGVKFYKAVLGKSHMQVHKQWLKLLLSGQASAPLKASSDAEVKKMVSRHAYAIGYIAANNLDDSVREILRVD